MLVTLNVFLHSSAFNSVFTETGFLSHNAFCIEFQHDL